MLDVELLHHFPGFTLDVKWSADAGVVALFGPSGAGKTLTLECLAGLLRPDGGRITLGGRSLYDSLRGVHRPPRDRRLGTVFQGYALFPHLSVEENLGFGLARLSRSARRQRTEELLERFRLAEVRRLRPAALSGGQQQRVALGRALASDPELLLLDEPLAALDSPLRRTLRDELAGMLRGFGKMAVVVTHDLAEACQLADRIVVYDHGRVVQEGPSDHVVSRPASVEVAAALGMRNVLEGVVVNADAGGVQLLWRGHLLVAEAGSRTRPTAGSRVRFFIRPEHVRLMRKDRYGSQELRQTNLVRGSLVGEVDMGAMYALQFVVEGEGDPPARGYDLEIAVPKLVHEKLCLHYDRQWTVSVQPSAVELLPTA
jgi:ABC-type sulfate/molybdate transport systems ATPase subunit